MNDDHTVWYTRYGALLYYPAASYEEAVRFIRVYAQIGEIQVKEVLGPDNEVVEVLPEDIWK